MAHTGTRCGPSPRLSSSTFEFDIIHAHAKDNSTEFSTVFLYLCAIVNFPIKWIWNDTSRLPLILFPYWSILCTFSTTYLTMGKTYARRRLSKSMKGRVSKLEAQMRARKPEMKIHPRLSTPTVPPLGIEARELPTLDAGPGISDRIGNQIRIHKIECRFDCGGPGVDVFLIKSSDETAPVASDFFPQQTGGLLPNATNSPFTVLRHFYRTGDIHDGRFVYKSKQGILVQYRGTTAFDCIKNNFWLVFKNGSAGSRIIPNCTYIHYTDC